MSEVMQRDQQEVEDIAKAKGLICFLPEPNELFLDLDKGAQINEGVLKVLADNGLHIKDQLTTVSKGGNKHIYIRLDKALRGNMVRIALQTALGSDAVKEALSVLRMMGGSIAPIALFETMIQAKRVEQWRAQAADHAISIYSTLDDLPY